MVWTYFRCLKSAYKATIRAFLTFYWYLILGICGTKVPKYWYAICSFVLLAACVGGLIAGAMITKKPGM